MLSFSIQLLKSLSNYVKLKSLRSNKFKQQLSKDSLSAALVIRWTCKQKQNKNPLAQVYTTPAVWFPQQSSPAAWTLSQK